jgi:hypothetical protein
VAGIEPAQSADAVDAKKLSMRLREIAMTLQYLPSGEWGVETIGPIVEAADRLAALSQSAAAAKEGSHG